MRLTSAPVLAYPQFDKPFILDTDASNVGIGGVLSQIQDGKECVIAYGSRSLTKSERNYCVTRRELLALVSFTRHFRCYLLGRHFTARTDHKALEWLQKFKEPEGQVARWIEQLQQYDFSITHRAGEQHGNADGLSRIPCTQCGEQHQVLNWVNSVVPTPLSLHMWSASEDVSKLQAADPDLGPLWKRLTSGSPRSEGDSVSGSSATERALWAQWNRLMVRDGLVYRVWQEMEGGEPSEQLVAPRTLVPKVLEMLHNGSSGGHLGDTKTLHKVRERFYWPCLKEDVELWCRQCKECSQRKSPSKTPRAPMVPVRTGFSMERIAMDILGPLPLSHRGNKYVLVVTDYFTRWSEAYPLPNQEAITVARILVDE